MANQVAHALGRKITSHRAGSHHDLVMEPASFLVVYLMHARTRLPSDGSESSLIDMLRVSECCESVFRR